MGPDVKDQIPTIDKLNNSTTTVTINVLTFVWSVATVYRRAWKIQLRLCTDDCLCTDVRGKFSCDCVPTFVESSVATVYRRLSVYRRSWKIQLRLCTNVRGKFSCDCVPTFVRVPTFVESSVATVYRRSWKVLLSLC